MEHVRVRFAPSPTGYLHIGGARTALFNWFFARKYHGDFILRIEDTDTDRLKEDSVDQILRSMKWLGLDWDEGPEKEGSFGPYYQSQRQKIYQKEVKRLLLEEKAYYCFCTTDELEAEREKQRQAGQPFRYNRHCRNLPPEETAKRLAAGDKYVIRIKSPDKDIAVNDLIRGHVVFPSNQMDDYIIVKSNGMPTYNFACVVDDHTMEMTHVIRAEEHLSNTPKQIIIYQALGYKLPQFAHLPMILAPDRSKLSKRHGATSVEEFRDQGIFAESIVNYLTLLGWSPGNDEEIFSMQETVEKFSLERVSKNAAIYDTQKLTWMNGKYLTALDLKTVTQQAIPYFIQKGLVSAEEAITAYEHIQNIVAAVREKVKTLPEVAEASSYFFQDISHYDEKGIKKRFTKDGVAELLIKGKEALSQVTDFDVAHTEDAYRLLIEAENIKGGDLIHPTRLALTGRTMGPGLFDVIALLGKEKCLARMDQAITFIKAMG